MARLSLGPLVEPGGIHDNLSIWRQFYVRAIHWTRCRSFKVDTFAVVSAPVARALKLVFAGLPIGCAAQVSAAGVDDKHAVRRAVHPYAVLLLPFGIDAEGVVRSVTNDGQPYSRCRFGRTHGRRTNIPGCISATGSG